MCGDEHFEKFGTISYLWPGSHSFPKGNIFIVYSNTKARQPTVDRNDPIHFNEIHVKGRVQ